MRPGPPSSTLILRLQRPTAFMPTVAPAGGGWGLRTPAGSPSPVVLHDLCACPATGLECVPLGFGGQGSLEAFLLILALPGGTHAMGKVGMHGALETPLGLLARPRGKRQETKVGGEAWLTTTTDPPSAWGWAGLAQLPHAHGGGTLPTSGWGLPELMSAEDTGVESLSPWQVFWASPGRGPVLENSDSCFVVFSFCFLHGGRGTKTCLGASDELSKALSGS